MMLSYGITTNTGEVHALVLKTIQLFVSFDKRVDPCCDRDDSLIVTALFGMLSGPMAEMGVRDFIVRILKMDLVQAEREGRIIIFYHSIAMAVVAIETYMITGLLKMRDNL